MKKSKWIFLSIIFTLLAFGIFIPNKSSIEVSADREQVTILDENLDRRIRALLDKDEDDKLYSNSFLTHENYKVRKDGDKEYAEIEGLNLHNAGITDIRELAQFEFPSTLKVIDLSCNNITFDQFDDIYLFLYTYKDTEIKIKEDYIIKSKTNFNQFKYINVSNNFIDLNKVKDSYIDINNERFIYGLQNFDFRKNSRIVTRDDLKDAHFYLRDNDYNIISNSLYHYTNPTSERPQEPKKLDCNKIINLDQFEVGKYEILISHVAGGFFGTTFVQYLNIDFLLIDGKIEPNEGSTSGYYEVERLDNFSLPNNYINIDGFGSLEFTAVNEDGASTKEIGVQKCIITINATGYAEKKIQLDYKVIDTTNPIITLIGGETLLWNYNTPWVDPGYIITDNGEKVNAVIVPPESVKHTLIGEYNLTYTYTDKSGNSATITRKVIIEKGILSTINLYTTNEKIEIDKELTLIASPYNIDKSKYYDFEYTWIINNEVVEIVKGDVAHNSSYTLTLKDKKPVNIKVKVTAKHVESDNIVMVYSNELLLEAEGRIKPTALTVVIFASAILIIMTIIAVTTLYKFKKSNLTTKSTSKKNQSSTKNNTKEDSKSNKKEKSKSKKNKKDDDDDDKKGITIIKDYKG